MEPGHNDAVERAIQEADRTQEVDLWLGCYATRAMLPSFLICGLATVLLVVGGNIVRVRFQLEPLQIRYTLYVICGCIWFVQLARWLYRVLTYNYRLTTRRVFLERSFLNSSRAELPLDRVLSVTVERSGWEPRLGVGSVCIQADEGAPGIEWSGVRDPDRLAEQIRRLVEETREGKRATVPSAPGQPAAGHLEGKN